MDMTIRDEPRLCQIGDGVLCSRLRAFPEFLKGAAAVRYLVPAEPEEDKVAAPAPEAWLFKLVHTLLPDGVTASAYQRSA